MVSVLVATAILLLIGVVYFAAYFALGKPSKALWEPPSYSGTVRIFSKPWQVSLFTPAAKIESLIVGHEVSPIVLDAENPFG